MDDSIQETSIKFPGVGQKCDHYTFEAYVGLNYGRKIGYSAQQNMNEISPLKQLTQVVAEYVTITYYKDEASNVIINRELIPTHSIEHIMVSDL